MTNCFDYINATNVINVNGIVNCEIQNSNIFLEGCDKFLQNCKKFLQNYNKLLQNGNTFLQLF